ncbi:MAG: hypothetical protein JWN29_3823 [Acidimicrobiales bacterium]|jgi:hypothetical protein|nr:hypothetical protein [Acidimicrobiales bacterium]
MQPLPPIDAPEGAPALRQCGRCRDWFDGDPDALATALAEWWLCPPCRDVLLRGPITPSRP